MHSNLNCISKQKGIFFNLVNNALIQKVLVNTLIVKNNLYIEDLANLLNIDSKKLRRVWHGKEMLKRSEAKELVYLFYISSK